MSEVSREYYGSYGVDDEDQLQLSDTLDGHRVSDLPDEGCSPPRKWSASEGFGTTAVEALRGEIFEQRLAHSDLEEELVAADVGIDAGAASAEEAASHIVDDEPVELDDPLMAAPRRNRARIAQR
jgi:hypothetical protein